MLAARGTLWDVTHSNPTFTTVLLPGLACDAELWRAQWSVLAARHWPAISDAHHRADTIPAMAELVLSEHPGELVLVGASMGGRVALEAARRAPERVQGLALLGSTARADSETLRATRQQAIEMFQAGEGDDVLEANVWFVFDRSAWDDQALLDRYLAMVRRTSVPQLVRQNRAMMAAADARAGLGAIRCPTLVVCGEGDTITPPECSREIAAGIAGAQLHLLPDCGHMLTMEKPQHVNALLMDWLTRLA